MARANLNDPFAPVDLTIEYVDSAAGSRKTLTAVALALDAAKRGTKTIFAMPTLELIAEMAEVARRAGSDGRRVPVYVITSVNRPSKRRVEVLIKEHIASVRGGHLLFITHEGFQRVIDWPAETSGFELYIDEVIDVVLARTPFKLRYSPWVLTGWLDPQPVPTTLAERGKRQHAPPEFTYDQPGRGTDQKTDESRLRTCEMIAQPTSNAAPNVKEGAAKLGLRLLAKQRAWEAWRNGGSSAADRDLAMSYYLLVPSDMKWAKLREESKHADDIYEYLDPLQKWIVQGNPLFTEMSAWNKLTIKPDPDDQDAKDEYYGDPQRGLVTITGFRRPDALKAFARVTIMSALFKHTMLYAVWSTLGVTFVPSQAIPLAETATALGKRRLRLYWLSDQGWSKRARDQSGGIEKILRLIKDAGVISDAPVCVVVNKDDGSEANPKAVTDVFPQGIVMPHNVRGQNRWREYHQLIHCAALNSYTSDIRYLETVLGIDAATQRIARTGQEIYQALMRLSLRDPTARSDVTLVVMDKDVADWLVQWFIPSDQVEVNEIDSSGVIKRRGKTGRPPIGERRMTAAEQKRHWRLNHRRSDNP